MICIQFYRTVSYYIAQVALGAPVGQMETFLLSILSYFAVGMSNHDWWSFFYFWAMFALVTLNGSATSRILAYSLPTPDIASSLGSAASLFFVLGAGNSPQYGQLPSWLKWIGWISPCAYCYEGVMVNELLNRTVDSRSGSDFGQQALGIPRIPYEDASITALSTERQVMAFDAYMLIVLFVFFESK